MTANRQDLEGALAAVGESGELFRSVLSRLLADGALSCEASILCVCGGETDRRILGDLGFTRVTISNADVRMEGAGDSLYAPYAWSRQDAENLAYPDGHFDFCFVHHGLHHCRCPQRAIQQMYRVATRGVLGVEPAKGWFTRLGVRLGFGQEYETAAVYFNGCRYGGVENTAIPNYVYRFDRSDIVRAVQSFAPVAEHKCRFWYGTRVPERLMNLRNPVYGRIVRIGRPAFEWAGRTFPALANNMAFFIPKPVLPRDLFPWLRIADGAIVPSEEYLERLYTRG